MLAQHRAWQVLDDSWLQNKGREPSSWDSDDGRRWSHLWWLGWLITHHSPLRELWISRFLLPVTPPTTPMLKLTTRVISASFLTSYPAHQQVLLTQTPKQTWEPAISLCLTHLITAQATILSSRTTSAALLQLAAFLLAPLQSVLHVVAIGIFAKEKYNLAIPQNAPHCS